MKNHQFQNQLNREPVYAGKFYPATSQALKNELDNLFAAAKEKEGTQQPLAIIAPHAGYVFSGHVAASAYNQISDKTTVKRIFVIASSHQFLFGGAAVFDSGNYETPLGEVKVDTKLGRELTESNELFRHYPEAHQFEHSLEVQLPFLQYKLGNNFLLVPVVIGTNNPDDCKSMAKTLEPWFAPENLFVVSTDFSHYPGYDDAIETDLQTAQAICSNNPKKLLTKIDENKRKKIDRLATSLCGWTSVLTLLYITEGKEIQFKKLAYQNSGDNGTYGDKDHVVGYWALAIYNDQKPFAISQEEQNELLDKARTAIVQFLKTGRQSKPGLSRTGGILNESTGVFVSVYVKSELRGCMGNFAKEETLNDLVQKMAVSAACDYRFKKLKTDDLPDMELEISVLSPLKKIHSADEIQLGKHGIYIKKDIYSGTFLPQVAKKTGWNTEEFLGHCSRDKANLGWEGWKNAELYVYEAFVFRG